MIFPLYNCSTLEISSPLSFGIPVGEDSWSRFRPVTASPIHEDSYRSLICEPLFLMRQHISGLYCIHLKEKNQEKPFQHIVH